MGSLEERAAFFATEMHSSQQRKYTGEPYIVHPRAVAEIVRSVSHTEEMLAAAWLHDVVEDTPATIEDIRFRFGDVVAALVSDLTDVSCPSGGNRARRKAMDREHSGNASREAKTIKLADVIDNRISIQQHDPDFSVVYLREMRLLLPLLKDGDSGLWKRAAAICNLEDM